MTDQQQQEQHNALAAPLPLRPPRASRSIGGCEDAGVYSCGSGGGLVRSIAYGATEGGAGAGGISLSGPLRVMQRQTQHPDADRGGEWRQADVQHRALLADLLESGPELPSGAVQSTGAAASAAVNTAVTAPGWRVPRDEEAWAARGRRLSGVGARTAPGAGGSPPERRSRPAGQQGPVQQQPAGIKQQHQEYQPSSEHRDVATHECSDGEQQLLRAFESISVDAAAGAELLATRLASEVSSYAAGDSRAHAHAHDGHRDEDLHARVSGGVLRTMDSYATHSEAEGPDGLNGQGGGADGSGGRGSDGAPLSPPTLGLPAPLVLAASAGGAVLPAGPNSQGHAASRFLSPPASPAAAQERERRAAAVTAAHGNTSFGSQAGSGADSPVMSPAPSSSRGHFRLWPGAPFFSSFSKQRHRDSEVAASGTSAAASAAVSSPGRYRFSSGAGGGGGGSSRMVASSGDGTSVALASAAAINAAAIAAAEGSSPKRRPDSGGGMDRLRLQRTRVRAIQTSASANAHSSPGGSSLALGSLAAADRGAGPGALMAALQARSSVGGVPSGCTSPTAAAALALNGGPSSGAGAGLHVVRGAWGEPAAADAPDGVVVGGAAAGAAVAGPSAAWLQGTAAPAAVLGPAPRVRRASSALETLLARGGASAHSPAVGATSPLGKSTALFTPPRPPPSSQTGSGRLQPPQAGAEGLGGNDDSGYHPAPRARKSQEGPVAHAEAGSRPAAAAASEAVSEPLHRLYRTALAAEEVAPQHLKSHKQQTHQQTHQLLHNQREPREQARPSSALGRVTSRLRALASRALSRSSDGRGGSDVDEAGHRSDGAAVDGRAASEASAKEGKGFRKALKKGKSAADDEPLAVAGSADSISLHRRRLETGRRRDSGSAGEAADVSSFSGTVVAPAGGVTAVGDAGPGSGNGTAGCLRPQSAARAAAERYMAETWRTGSGGGSAGGGAVRGVGESVEVYAAPPAGGGQARIVSRPGASELPKCSTGGGGGGGATAGHDRWGPGGRDATDEGCLRMDTHVSAPGPETLRTCCKAIPAARALSEASAGAGAAAAAVVAAHGAVAAAAAGRVVAAFAAGAAPAPAYE
eukprot:XP_001695366.1 predicted protein [Chlamydomonas reinhardtii]